MSATPSSALRRVALAVTALAASITLSACDAGSPAEPSAGTVEELPPPPVEPPPVPPPVVERRAPSSVQAPDDMASYCIGVENERSFPATCPMVVWRGRQYWAHAYRDNRSAMGITAYDSTGTVVGVREVPGARYLKAIEVVMADSTIVFRGQSDREVVLRWSELP